MKYAVSGLYLRVTITNGYKFQRFRKIADLVDILFKKCNLYVYILNGVTVLCMYNLCTHVTEEDPVNWTWAQTKHMEFCTYTYCME